MANKKLICLEDFEREARDKLDRNAWVYYSSGAMMENTIKDNAQAYNRYLIRPHVLRDVSNVDLSTTILGNRISFPVGVSPSAFHCLAHPDGENATAKACHRIDTCMVLSSWSTIGLEEVADTNGDGLRWFQIYFYDDFELTKQMVGRIEAAGYKAIVFTIDTPVSGRKQRISFKLPSHLSVGHFKSGFSKHSKYSNLREIKVLGSPQKTWEAVDKLRSITSLPIILKGILRPDDAREALKHDIQGIIVSNHGGRHMDSIPAAIDVLSDIVKEVNGRVEVYIDGGIRHGTDVLKALALGARAVFIGKPILYGLACNGEEGAYQVLNILKEEVQQAFTLSGCNSVNEVQATKDLVVHKTFYTHPKSKL